MLAKILGREYDTIRRYTFNTLLEMQEKARLVLRYEEIETFNTLLEMRLEKLEHFDLCLIIFQYSIRDAVQRGVHDSERSVDRALSILY